MNFIDSIYSYLFRKEAMGRNLAFLSSIYFKKEPLTEAEETERAKRVAGCYDLITEIITDILDEERNQLLPNIDNQQLTDFRLGKIDGLRVLQEELNAYKSYSLPEESNQ
jgi:hypothetical protein